jgi:hypothetical protein
MGLVMRMFHAGAKVVVAGDMTTFAVGANDHFLLTCGQGELSVATAQMSGAKSATQTNLE